LRSNVSQFIFRGLLPSIGLHLKLGMASSHVINNPQPIFTWS
jgi:hypothetical protein